MPEPTEHLIEVRPDGSLHFLYDDALAPLMEAGTPEVCRASHVEPTQAYDEHGNKLGKVVWYADMAPVGGPMLGAFDTRDEALRAERAWLHSHNLPDPKTS